MVTMISAAAAFSDRETNLLGSPIETAEYEWLRAATISSSPATARKTSDNRAARAYGTTIPFRSVVHMARAIVTARLPRH